VTLKIESCFLSLSSFEELKIIWYSKLRVDSGSKLDLVGSWYFQGVEKL